MSKLYSYYKDGFYGGIYRSESGECLPISYLSITQIVLTIPNIECTVYDGLDGGRCFEEVGDYLYYQGERLDGVVEWHIEEEDDVIRNVSILLEFPVIDRDFSEGFVGSGCYLEEDF